MSLKERRAEKKNRRRELVLRQGRLREERELLRRKIEEYHDKLQEAKDHDNREKADAIEEELEHLHQRKRNVNRELDHIEARLGNLAKIIRQLTRRIAAVARPDWNGCPPLNDNKFLSKVVKAGNRRGLWVTSTTGGAHSSTSWHYRRKGLDMAAAMTADGIEKMYRFQNFVLKKWLGNLLELFGPDNDACAKNGTRITLAEGSALENQHDNHDHIAGPR